MLLKVVDIWKRPMVGPINGARGAKVGRVSAPARRALKANVQRFPVNCYMSTGRSLSVILKSFRITSSNPKHPKGKVTVNKAELIELVGAKANLSKTDAGEAVEAVFKGIQDTLQKGDSVTLVGFGTFSVSERASRTGRNPRTGEAITIPASKSPKFKAGKALKDALN